MDIEKNFNIICFSNIDWGFIYQRHQHLMNAFGKLNYVNKIVYVETLGTRTIKLNAEDIKRIFKKIFTFFISRKKREIKYEKSMNNKISIVTPLAIPFFNNLFFYINEKFLEIKLDREISRLNIDPKNTIAWVNLSHPSVYNYVKKRGFKKVIYDCIDDIKSIPNMNSSIVRCEEKFIQDADLVFSTSKELYRKCKKLNHQVKIVPNAVSQQFIKRKRIEIQNEKKIIGYVGTIYEWFDDDLLYKCAKEYPEINFCIVGPVRINIDRFKELSNVIFEGKVSYDKVEKYIESFDVCIIPFKINELTLNTNPVKIFEYFSKGKPVISTSLPELEEYSDDMYIAMNNEDFIKKIEKALFENSLQLYNKRISIASMNTWEDRVQLIFENINNLEK